MGNSTASYPRGQVFIYIGLQDWLAWLLIYMAFLSLSRQILGYLTDSFHTLINSLFTNLPIA
jgi:hypothetical protein